jgi:hypothetical protein
MRFLPVLVYWRGAALRRGRGMFRLWVRGVVLLLVLLSLVLCTHGEDLLEPGPL